jgi:hypothetical protein
MTTATVYILLSNDGEEDFILTSDKLLHNRLADIRAYNTAMKNEKTRVSGCQCEDSVEAQIADVTETHLLWIHRRFHPYVAIAHTFVKTQVYTGNQSLSAGGQVQFDMEYAGEFYNKACLHVKLSSGTIADDAGDEQYWSWVPYLGHSFGKDYEFRVNTSELDKYDNHFAHSNYEFEVPQNQKAGYLRCIGQQVPEVARVNQFESAITATGGVLGNIGYDEEVSLVNGPQCRKIVHDEVEMFIPLWFWWNLESQESFAALTVPNGQRIVKVTLEKLENLVQMYDKDGAAIAYDASQWTTAPVISELDFYIQNIYVNPEINDIYIDKIGFNQVRLHRQQEVNISSASFNERLSLLKWPIEEIRIAALPRENLTNTRIEDRWSYGVVDPQTVNLAGRWHGDPTSVVTTQLSATHRKCYEIVKTLTLQLQGLKLYDAFPAKFFRDFTPTKFSEHQLRRAPESCGWHMININQKPGTIAASGHVNVSRIREVFLQGVLEHVGTGAISPSVSEIVLYVLGKCINFVFVTNGNIIVRYVG